MHQIFFLRWNLHSSVSKLFLFTTLLLFNVHLLADKVVIEKVSLNQQEFPDKTLVELKTILLQKAKIEAAKDIYGELIVSNTNLSNGKMVAEDLQNISIGVVHIKGNPEFSNGKTMGEIRVKIIAYATQEEIKSYRKEVVLQVASQAKKVKKTTQPEQDFYGSWSGYIMSPKYGTSKVVVTITKSGQSKIQFSTLNCGGDLVVKVKDIKYVEFKEYLNYGYDQCRDKDKIILVKKNINEVIYSQYSDDKQKIAHGTLYREN